MQGSEWYEQHIIIQTQEVEGLAIIWWDLPTQVAVPNGPRLGGAAELIG